MFLLSFGSLLRGSVPGWHRRLQVDHPRLKLFKSWSQPRMFSFTTKFGTRRGSKGDFCYALSSVTGVPKEILLMQNSVAIYSMAQRMSWASRRTATRIEDTAYCLLGVFWGQYASHPRRRLDGLLSTSRGDCHTQQRSDNLRLESHWTAWRVLQHICCITNRFCWEWDHCAMEYVLL